MNKLQKMLNSTSKEVRGARAKLLTDSMRRAQDRLVMDLEEAYDKAQENLNSLSDVYPNSEMSLRIVSKDFDPRAWVKDTQALKVELETRKLELDLAKETLAEWFEEEDEGSIEVAKTKK